MSYRKISINVNKKNFFSQIGFKIGLKCLGIEIKFYRL